MLLADRVYEHCFNDGELTDDAQRARWAALNNFIYNAVVCESARWGDGLEDGVTRTRNNQWQTEVDRVDGVMDGNVAALMGDMYENNYYPNLDPPTFNQHGGEVNAGFSLTMSNPNGSGTIYYRLDGGDPREAGGSLSSQAQTYGGSITLPATTTVNARIKNGNEWSAVHTATFFVDGPITGIYINEFLAVNNSDISTPGGDFEDWIEIYNSNNMPINLAGLFMTDDLGNLTKHQIPATNAAETTVPANGFLYLWADGVPQAGAHHLGFKLSGNGEDIGLVQVINGTPQVIDQLTYAVQTADISFGRYPDGSATFELFSQTTPGASNISDGGGDPITGLFINELMARNTAGITDPGGQFEDWVEIYNSNAEAIDIGGLYLTDDKGIPNLYQIPTSDPASTTIPAGGFLRLWADGETVDGILHLDFQFNGQGEFIGLVESVGGSLEFIDSLSFGPQVPNISWQRFPDGNANQVFCQSPTPQASNIDDQPPSPTPVTGIYINEILASNTTDITDEAGEFEDWFELYNSNGSPVDIGGLFLTDNYNHYSLWQIPSGTSIPAGGFIYFWADQDEVQGPLHTNFQLTASGEEIGLYQFTGTGFEVVDSMSFGNQQSNISFGRYPDGDANKEKMTQTTPGASNIQSPVVNLAPVIDPISDQTHAEGSTISLFVTATDPEGDDISFSQSGLPAGLSINSTTGEISGTITDVPNTYAVSITATDNGDPTESSQVNFTWTVTEFMGANEFWLELECADQIPAAWTEVQGGSYSNGAYLSTTSGENLPEPTNFSTALRFDIETSEAGTYYIYWRTEGASGHNSIWYYDGSGWERADIDNSFSWQSIGQISLSQGIHSLYFAKREGVPVADKMYVGLIDTAPSGAGEGATNCAPPPAIINGNISLNNCGGEDLSIKLYSPGTSTEILSTTVSIDANGDFSLPDISPGTYDIYIKLVNSLQKLQTETLESGTNSISFGSLQMGDVNNDNLVNFTDFGLLSGSFNQASGSGSYVPGADFNCDNLVNFTDFGLLSGNFNQAGDMP